MELVYLGMIGLGGIGLAICRQLAKQNELAEKLCAQNDILDVDAIEVAVSDYADFKDTLIDALLDEKNYSISLLVPLFGDDDPIYVHFVDAERLEIMDAQEQLNRIFKMN